MKSVSIIYQLLYSLGSTQISFAFKKLIGSGTDIQIVYKNSWGCCCAPEFVQDAVGGKE